MALSSPLLSDDSELRNTSDSLSYSPRSHHDTGLLSGLRLSPTLDFTRRPQASGNGLGLRSQDPSAMFPPASMNFGQYQSGQFFPPQTYDPSASYLLGECERLRRENANLNAALQLLKDTNNKKLDEIGEQVHSLTAGFKELSKTVTSALENAHPSSPDGAHSTFKAAKHLDRLDQKDFQAVWYWDREPWSKLRGGKAEVKPDDPVLTIFLEDANGKPVPKQEMQAVRNHANGYFVGLWDTERAPSSWKYAPLDVRVDFVRKLEEEFEFLRYCDRHWKSEQIFMNYYPQFLKSRKKPGLSKRKERADSEGGNDEENPNGSKRSRVEESAPPPTQPTPRPARSNPLANVRANPDTHTIPTVTPPPPPAGNSSSSASSGGSSASSSSNVPHTLPRPRRVPPVPTSSSRTTPARPSPLVTAPVLAANSTQDDPSLTDDDLAGQTENSSTAFTDEQNSIGISTTTPTTSTNATTPGSRDETHNNSSDNRANSDNSEAQNGGDNNDTGSSNAINDDTSNQVQEPAGSSGISGPSNPLSSNKGTRRKKATGKKATGKKATVKGVGKELCFEDWRKDHKEEKKKIFEEHWKNLPDDQKKVYFDRAKALAFST